VKRRELYCLSLAGKHAVQCTKRCVHILYFLLANIHKNVTCDARARPSLTDEAGTKFCNKYESS